MFRHHATLLAIALTLGSGLYAGYALVGSLAPSLLGDEPLTRLPMIRLDIAHR